jgi:diadenosine tetraphosphate (Ap4A) HIT family hydrolase
MNSNNCDLCNEWKGENCYFKEVFTSDKVDNRIVLKTRYSWVIAGLGALGPGYLLILPERHVPAIGYLSPDELDDIINIKKRVSKLITKMFSDKYGKVVFFEHGSNNKGFLSGKSVDHAHLHALPGGNIDFRLPLLRDFKECEIEGLEELRNLSNKDIPYLFYEDPEGRCYTYLPEKDIPSQYIRRVWAQGLGLPDRYNWREFIEKPNVLETLKILESSKDT